MNTTESDRISQPPAAPLRGAGLAVRLISIVGALVVTGGLFLYAGGWFTPHELTPAAIINTFEYVNGVHPGFRRNHAKGVCVTGYFESNGSGTGRLQGAGVSSPAACLSLGGLRWREESHMPPTHRKPSEASPFCSNSPTAKSGGRP